MKNLTLLAAEGSVEERQYRSIVVKNDNNFIVAVIWEDGRVTPGATNRDFEIKELEYYITLFKIFDQIFFNLKN